MISISHWGLIHVTGLPASFRDALVRQHRLLPGWLFDRIDVNDILNKRHGGDYAAWASQPKTEEKQCSTH